MPKTRSKSLGSSGTGSKSGDEKPRQLSARRSVGRSRSRSRSRSRTRSSSRSRSEVLKNGSAETLKKPKEVKPIEAKPKEEKPKQSKRKESTREKSPKEEKSTKSPKEEKPTKSVEAEASESKKEREKSTEKSVEKRTSIGRQSTPPRPRPARDLEGTRSSLRIREKQQQQSSGCSEKLIEAMGTAKITKGKSVPRTKEYAFGGPIGATLLILLLPLATYLLNFVGHQDMRKLIEPKSWFEGVSLASCFDQKSALIFLGWFIFQTLIAIIPFGGKRSEGLPLHGSGKRLTYNCNGFFALIFTFIVFGSFVFWDMKFWNGKLMWFTYVIDHYLPLMMSALFFSVMMSVLLYLKARFAAAHALAPEGNSGIFIFDFFMGHELNPRIASFDLKFFCEFRPGLIGWVFLDMAFCVKYWQLYGHWNPAMILITLFHLLYVADALFFEEAILTTMDITHEGFGFMLAFGDLVWVPFTYTLTVRYLLLRAVSPVPAALLISAGVLCLLGYWIFRASNSQKDQFRRDPRHPSVADLSTVATTSGRRLLAGGWWGLVRHPNYLGDIVMSIGWSVPCGVSSALPWFYPIYLTGLLVSRELRDERACAKKHGPGWEKYRELVPYRILPRVF